MPMSIPCQQCGKKLIVGTEHLGRKGRCSGCRKTFLVDQWLLANREHWGTVEPPVTRKIAEEIELCLASEFQHADQTGLLVIDGLSQACPKLLTWLFVASVVVVDLTLLNWSTLTNASLAMQLMVWLAFAWATVYCVARFAEL